MIEDQEKPYEIFHELKDFAKDTEKRFTLRKKENKFEFFTATLVSKLMYIPDQPRWDKWD